MQRTPRRSPSASPPEPSQCQKADSTRRWPIHLRAATTGTSCWRPLPLQSPKCLLAGCRTGIPLDISRVGKADGYSPVSGFMPYRGTWSFGQWRHVEGSSKRHWPWVIERGCVIAGWGTALPPTVVSNHEIESLIDTNDEWIVERSGIRTRRVAAGPFVSPSAPAHPSGGVGTTATLAVEAGRRALRSAGATG